MDFPPVRKLTVLFVFLGLLGCYLSLSPGAIAGMGYTNEEMQSGDRLLTDLDAWRKGVPIPPMVWSRNGLEPVLLDLPFLAVGKFVVSGDFVLSAQPVLLTAALCAVLFLWL